MSECLRCHKETDVHWCIECSDEQVEKFNLRCPKCFEVYERMWHDHTKGELNILNRIIHPPGWKVWAFLEHEEHTWQCVAIVPDNASAHAVVRAMRETEWEVEFMVTRTSVVKMTTEREGR